MVDDVVSHAFSHGFHPQHVERLAAYWAWGAGPKTAVWAGLAVWIVGAVPPTPGSCGCSASSGADPTVMTTAGGIVEAVVAALAGAALYQEGARKP